MPAPKKSAKKTFKKTAPLSPAQILSAFKKTGARIETVSRVKLKTKADLALYYTPGVGVASAHLGAHPQDARQLSVKRNSVAVISDGSAVLGLGNIGPYGALPVMEGKALIFKTMANIDAWPIVLDTQDPDEIVRVVKAIAPSFGGINLEDIKAPQCFAIEQQLIDALDIPVMHDDQHGTAIVVLAGLLNAVKVTGKQLKKLRVVIAGAGAAGTAVAKLLVAAGVSDVIVYDRGGSIYEGRSDLNEPKQELAAKTNPRKAQGTLKEGLVSADVCIGLSGPGLLTRDDIATMAPQAVVFALSNPTPEILPDEARAGGAAVIATGRSDFPNQINNALVFPGIFRGALNKDVRSITEETKLRAAKALASLVEKPTAEKLLPDIFDARVVPAIAKAVR
jgi:malate dehydrogenase (oxaloacetate-decarboxylating)